MECAHSLTDKVSRFGRDDGGSIPSGRARAHSSTVEQLPLKESVGGSNPPALTKKAIVQKRSRFSSK